MLTHSGTLFLSRAQPPLATRAMDGTATITLLAIDRTPYIPQPYLLIWTGVQALAFWYLHSNELTEGAALHVDLTNVRMHVTKSRPEVAQLLADVSSLQVLPSANKPRKYLKSKQTVSTADAGLAAIY